MRSFALFGFVAIVGCASAEVPIGLEAAIELALQQNPTLRLQALRLTGKDLAIEKERLAFAVTLSPYVRLQKADDFEEKSGGISISRSSTWGTRVQFEAEAQRRTYDGVGDASRNVVRLKLAQPLLQRAGGLVGGESLRQAEEEKLRALRELEMRKGDLIVRVVEVYQRLFLLQQQREFDERRLERLERSRRLMELKERQGHVGRIDVFRIDLQVGEARVRLAETLEAIDSVRAELAELLGLPIETQLVAQPVTIPYVSELSSREAMEVAESNRLDFAQVCDDLERAKRGVRIARRRVLPDLAVEGGVERSGQGDDPFSAASLDEDRWWVGLSLNPSDVFRRSERLGLQEARLEERSSEMNMELVRRALQRQVEQAVASYRRARANLPLAERNFQIAESRLRLAQRLFERGQATSENMADAEDALLDAQNRVLRARADVIVEAFKLLHVLGMLVEAPPELKMRSVAVSHGDREARKNNP